MIGAILDMAYVRCVTVSVTTNPPSFAFVMVDASAGAERRAVILVTLCLMAVVSVRKFVSFTCEYVYDVRLFHTNL